MWVTSSAKEVQLGLRVGLLKGGLDAVRNLGLGELGTGVGPLLEGTQDLVLLGLGQSDEVLAGQRLSPTVQFAYAVDVLLPG